MNAFNRVTERKKGEMTGGTSEGGEEEQQKKRGKGCLADSWRDSASFFIGDGEEWGKKAIKRIIVCNN